MSETPAEIIDRQLSAFEDEVISGEVFYSVRTDKIIAALAAAGYKILPREPTEAMIDATRWHAHTDDNVWRAMWDAAP